MSVVSFHDSLKCEDITHDFEILKNKKIKPLMLCIFGTSAASWGQVYFIFKIDAQA